MTKDRTPLRDGFTDDDGSGWLDRFLTEEDNFDARAKWRLASWGVGTVAAITVAILAMRSPAALNRDQLASAELAQQSQQVQWIAKDSQNKARELAAAVETLNSDRDRLYARLTVLEQNLDSVTGTLSRQPAPAPVAAASPAPSPQPAAADAGPIGPPAPPPEAKVEPKTDTKSDAKPEVVSVLPKIAPVTTTTPAPAPVKAVEAKAQEPKAPEPKGTEKTSADAKTSEAKSSGAKSDTPAVESQQPATTASINPADTAPDIAASTVRRTEFGVDIGGANSIEGLRAVWRGALKNHVQRFASLQPIIVVKERNDGFGMQLRLVAGPLTDAAEAAKLCATLTESNRSCETAVYEGQRLSMTNEKKPEPVVRRSRRRSKASVAEAPAPPPQTQTSSFGGFFSGK